MFVEEDVVENIKNRLRVLENDYRRFRKDFQGLELSYGSLNSMLEDDVYDRDTIDQMFADRLQFAPSFVTRLETVENQYEVLLKYVEDERKKQRDPYASRDETKDPDYWSDDNYKRRYEYAQQSLKEASVNYAELLEERQKVQIKADKYRSQRDAARNEIRNLKRIIENIGKAAK